MPMDAATHPRDVSDSVSDSVSDNVLSNVLAVDASSEWLSLGVMREGRCVATMHERCGPRMNALFFPRLTALLQQGGLTLKQMQGFVVVRGPGSFTGVRLGLSIVGTFAFTLHQPIVGVNTLEFLAHATDAEDPTPFHVLLNCVRQELYHARYRWVDGHLRALDTLCLLDQEQALQQVRGERVLLHRFPQGEAHLACAEPVQLRDQRPPGERLLALGQVLLRTQAQRGEELAGKVPQAVYLKPDAVRQWQPPSLHSAPFSAA